MFNKLRSKITEFISCEEGKVGIKTSLSLGLVGGGLLLMQTVFPSAANADIECWNNDQCDSGEQCYFWYDSNGDLNSRCFDA